MNTDDRFTRVLGAMPARERTLVQRLAAGRGDCAQAVSDIEWQRLRNLIAHYEERVKRARNTRGSRPADAPAEVLTERLALLRELRDSLPRDDQPSEPDPA